MMELKTFEKATMATTGMASAVALMAGAAQAQDQAFDGLYMGLSLSSLSGRTPLGDYYDPYSLESKPTAGMFLGFNKRVGGGNMVAGAELAFQGWTPGDDDDNSSYETYGIHHVIDLKAKLGTVVETGSTGPILLYGVAGLSTGIASSYYGQDYDFTGYNYGVGAEMSLSENFSVGLEVLGRNVDAYNETDPATNTNHHQISLRGSFQF